MLQPQTGNAKPSNAADRSRNFGRPEAFGRAGLNRGKVLFGDIFADHVTGETTDNDILAELGDFRVHQIPDG
jgi:hypothetical protein